MMIPVINATKQQNSTSSLRRISMLTLLLRPTEGRNEICNLNASVPACRIPPSLHPPPGRVWPVRVSSSSNAQCEQFNDTNSDHQHGERDRIVVKQIPLLGIHNNALSGYCWALTRHSTRGSLKGVSSVSLACCDAGDDNSMRRNCGRRPIAAAPRAIGSRGRIRQRQR